MNYICVTCGSQFTETPIPPKGCPICQDERQYVGHDGQKWTILIELKRDYRNRVQQLEPKLYGVGTEPRFAIGQRALLVCSSAGNLLWDCVSLIDDATVTELNELGGVAAIAISHPHYYSSVVDWAAAFSAEVYLHAADRKWLMRPSKKVTFWEGERLELLGHTLLRVGGHFAGGTVCHWRAGANGLGALLTGDIIQVVSDRRYVSFMYSYPNLIPLSAAEVEVIRDAVEPHTFDRLYGAWWNAVVKTNARESVRLSAERYVGAIRKSAGSS